MIYSGGRSGDVGLDMREDGLSLALGCELALIHSHYHFTHISYAQIQGIFTVFGFIFYALIAEETRFEVLRTKALKHARPDVEVEKVNLWPLIKVSVIRPFRKHHFGPTNGTFTLMRTFLPVYLCTEPIVIGLSAWVGFAWGVIFLFTSSVLIVFEQYGFSVGQSSTFLVWVEMLLFIGWPGQIG